MYDYNSNLSLLDSSIIEKILRKLTNSEYNIDEKYVFWIFIYYKNNFYLYS